MTSKKSKRHFPNRPLLSQSDRHPKIVKSAKRELPIVHAILHLAPAELSGYNVCPMASEGCKAACLHTSGHHNPRKYAARLWKTQMFFEARGDFIRRLHKELKSLSVKAKRQNAIACVRLNGTSDIPWETVHWDVSTWDNEYETYNNVMEAFPDIHFYDYTKRHNRKNLPSNYRLTFSRSEDNNKQCGEALDNGMNVAVVFRDKLPWRWKGLPVIDGDEHDYRFNDPHPCIVGLRAKGKGKHDTSGFVVDV